MPVAGGPADVYRAYLKEGFDNLLDHKNLWHAALERSAANPDFWSTYGPIRDQIGGITRSKIEAAMGRPLDDAERRKVALAGQVFNSVINNQIINGPGPLMLEDDDFYPELEKIVMNIAAVALGFRFRPAIAGPVRFRARRDRGISPPSPRPGRTPARSDWRPPRLPAQ